KGYGTVKNLAQMIDALKKSSLDAFVHHVNDNKNDIAQWGKDVYGDEHLAVALIKHNDRYSMIDILDASLQLAQKEMTKRNETITGDTMQHIPKEHQHNGDMPQKDMSVDNKPPDSRLASIEHHIEKLEGALAGLI